MTVWEQRILDACVQRYPSSAAAKGGNKMRLRVPSAFSAYALALPDVMESFLEAAESLERTGVISLVWDRHRKGETLSSIVLENPVQVFALTGRDSPVVIAERARLCACEEAAGFDVLVQQELFSFFAATIGPEDAVEGMTSALLREFAQLVRSYPGESEGLAPRALSVRLFSDSKKIETLLRQFRPLLQKAGRAGVSVPDFSALERSFPETLISGSLIFSFAEGPLSNPSGCILGLPYSSALRINSIALFPGGKRANQKRVLTVENKETFYVLSEMNGFDCVLYTAGHPNAAVARLCAVLALSGFAFFHAGDLDPDGILILQEIMSASGVRVEPYRMDTATFDRYLPFARSLEPTMITRFVQLSDETRKLPGIDDLVGRILSTAQGVEQEIIDYRIIP